MEANEPFGVYGQALSLASKDHVEAKKFLERACDLEHAEALGTMAEWLWEESSHAAVALWRRAAELGHSQSRSRLGSLLMHGVAGRGRGCYVLPSSKMTRMRRGEPRLCMSRV